MEDQRPYSLQRANGQETNYSAEYTGYGVARYPNGDRYEGDFLDGIREGKGKYYYANQDYYEGEFKNNQKHGMGKLQYPIKEDEATGKKSGGGSYIGYFENGFKHGEGLFTYANKDIYQGFWNAGKKHGKGTYIVFDRKVKLCGTWDEGNLIQGKWIFPNGTSYEGKFKNNQPIDGGQWQFNNGNLVKGMYKQTILPSDDPKNESKLKLKLDWKSSGEIISTLPAKPLVEFPKPIFIFVLGGPGAGKGTQCAKIIEDFNFHHLSTGDLLRAAKNTHPEIAQVMAEGKLVSSEMLIQLIQEAVNQRGNKGVFLLDGFPRSQENLTVWNKVIKEFVDVKFLLLFECTLQTLEKRLLGRAQTSGRDDDNPEAIKKRFVTFEQQTQPIIKSYKGIVEKISADGNVEEIYEGVKAVLRKHRLIR